MSSVYNLEPQPTGSVVINTNQGELAVELFAKQTPLTCRNFLQLCIDGYYDGTIFHRLVPGFILQGGDPTGTGNGGESIYDAGALSGDLDVWPMDQRKGRNAGPGGINFRDEIHSRLKFNRRGLLGMANEGVPDTNGSQFFFTLGKAEELNGKNTMFGRIAGDTIYNLAKMGEAEVEEGTEKPLYPVKITSIDILVNPFEDLKKRDRAPRVQPQKSLASEKKQQKKRKGGKQLLSFGDEEGDGDDLPAIKKAKFDARIVMDLEDDDTGKKQPKSAAKKEGKGAKRTVAFRAAPEEQAPQQTESSAPTETLSDRKKIKREDHYGSSPEPVEDRKPPVLEQTNAEIAALKASMRRTIHSEPVKEKQKSALEQLIPETSTRGRKRRPGGQNVSAKEEKESLDLLKAFREKLEGAPSEKREISAPDIANRDEAPPQESGADDGDGEVCDLHFIANCQSCQSWDKLEAKDESDDEGWMSHALSFAADKLGKDLSYRKKAEEELLVIDPLAKARTLKEEKRAERDARSGVSGRAWDQARNAQLAKNSALAGRGAK